MYLLWHLSIFTKIPMPMLQQSVKNQTPWREKKPQHFTVEFKIQNNLEMIYVILYYNSVYVFGV